MVARVMNVTIYIYGIDINSKFEVNPSSNKEVIVKIFYCKRTLIRNLNAEVDSNADAGGEYDDSPCTSY